MTEKLVGLATVAFVLSAMILSLRDWLHARQVPAEDYWPDQIERYRRYREALRARQAGRHRKALKGARQARCFAYRFAEAR